MQYKRCMALQFLDRHSEALEAVKAAVAGLEVRSARLKERLVAEESDGVRRAGGRPGMGGWELHCPVWGADSTAGLKRPFMTVQVCDQYGVGVGGQCQALLQNG